MQLYTVVHHTIENDALTLSKTLEKYLEKKT